MVGRCSRRSDLTPGRGSLMTNWCLTSITVSTLPTLVGSLNGSILSVNPLSLSLCLSLSLALCRVSNTPFSLCWPEGGTVGV